MNEPGSLNRVFYEVINRDFNIMIDLPFEHPGYDYGYDGLSLEKTIIRRCAAFAHMFIIQEAFKAETTKTQMTEVINNLTRDLTNTLKLLEQKVEVEAKQKHEVDAYKKQIGELEDVLIGRQRMAEKFEGYWNHSESALGPHVAQIVKQPALPSGLSELEKMVKEVLEKELQEPKERQLQMQREFQCLEKSILNLENQLEKANKTINSMAGENALAKSSPSLQLRHQISHLRSVNKELDDDLKQANETICDLLHRNSTLEIDNKEVLKTLKEQGYSKVLRSYLQELKRKEETIRCLEKELDETHEKFYEQQEENFFLMNGNENPEDMVDIDDCFKMLHLEERVLSLETELEEANEEITQLRKSGRQAVGSRSKRGPSDLEKCRKELEQTKVFLDMKNECCRIFKEENDRYKDEIDRVTMENNRLERREKERQEMIAEELFATASGGSEVGKCYEKANTPTFKLESA